ncbi:MAG: uroporphyrinogen decarboxylase family protein, partial [Candidatus Limnocylindria bacterium]
MTPRERLLAAVRGEAVDRPPFAVWRHFYPDESEGATLLARRTVAWTAEHALDLVKYNPRAHYHAEPWGTRYEYGGGARPRLARYAVQRSRDWPLVTRRTTSEPAFAELLEGLALVRAALPDVPLVATIFTPLGVLERLAGRERVLADLREEPDLVFGALQAVTATFRDLARRCAEVADGIFLATTSWAQRDVLDDEYARFGRPYDLEVLDGARGAPLNVLHVCGPGARVVELARYPVAAVSWNPHLAGTPSLGELLAAVPDRAAIGGLSDGALLAADGSLARSEIARALDQTGGRRWVAAGGCT